MTGTPEKGPKPTAAAAFVVRSVAIAAGLKDGHKMTTHYQQYGADLGRSYSQFTRYVARYREQIAA